MREKHSKEELQNRRLKIFEEMEKTKLRKINGQRLVNAISLATSDKVSISDFDMDRNPPFSVNWPSRLTEAEGLVEAYATKVRVIAIAKCIEAKLTDMSGLIGIYDKDYLGLCYISQINVTGMVDASYSANEAIVFYPSQYYGAILFDCYRSNPGDPFSVIVQGCDLIDRLGECFSK